MTWLQEYIDGMARTGQLGVAAVGLVLVLVAVAMALRGLRS